METLNKASEEGNIEGLYAAIRENPHILSIIDEIPFADTPLHIAAFAGHIQYAMEAMRLKPSFARKLNHFGFTPIHVALQENHTELVLWLINKDEELVRVKGREGITPLHYVVEKGNLQLVERFLSVCPQAVEDVTIRNETALHIALKNNKLDIFQVLMDRIHRDGSNGFSKATILDCKDVQGNTVLRVATTRNQLQALQVLMKYKNENPITISEPQQTHNQNPNSTIVESLTDREKIYAWENYFKFEYKKDKRDNTRSDLLVVGVLMATATYQAALSPPGGLSQDKPESLLASSYPWMYIIFITFNSFGFFLSLNTIRVLIYKYPLYWETYCAMLAMIATYDISINSISPSGRAVRIFGYISILMPLLVVIVPLLVRLCLKGGGSRLRGYKRHENV